MADDRAFIYETSREQAVKVILTLILLLVSIGIVGIILGQNEKGAVSLPDPIQNIVYEEVASVSPLGLFIIAFAGALFFMPSPVEFAYFLGLSKGHSPIILFFVTVLGIVGGNIINYLVGARFSAFIMHIVPKKKLFGARRWVSRYGGYMIFIFNLIPSPAPLLTFALGIIRYNMTRLFALLIGATVLKYAMVYAIHTLL